MTPRRTNMHKLLAALILAVAFGTATAAPALADGRHGGHERYEHREGRGHEWREHHDGRYYHPYHYGYGYAYPGYYGYYAPPAVYAPPPSLTVVVPFR
jgi:hypothetical protein